MILAKHLAAALLCCLLAAGGTAGARTPKHTPRYRVVPIDARLKVEGNRCLNNFGIVVGRVYFPKAKDGSQPFQAYRWEKGKLSSLGVSEKDFPSSYATAINDRGQIVGTITVQPEDAMFHSWGHAFFWERGHWQGLNTLLPDDVSYGEAVNSAGDVAISAQVLSMATPDSLEPDTQHPTYLVRADKVFPLGNGYVAALNNKGQVLVSGNHSFLWENGITREIHLPDADNFRFSDMNDHVQMIGQASRGAFLYESGHLTYLTHDPESVSNAINGTGQIVGDFSLPHTPTKPEVVHAFLWSNHTLYDLNRFVPRKSGWVFQEAISINDPGQIVGTGTHRGKPSGFLLTPVR